MYKFKEKGHGYLHFINEKTLNLAVKWRCHILGFKSHVLPSTLGCLLPNVLCFQVHYPFLHL